MTSSAPAAVTSVPRERTAITEPPLVRWTLIGIALAFVGLLLVLPVAVVLMEALRDGLGPYVAALLESNTLAALRLTVMTALIVVPINVVFGLAAAWAIARFDFWGKQVLIALVDLPFSVSPVICGMMFVLLFGAQGLLGSVLREHGVRIIFAQPGIVLATAFVTFPFVAREVVPLLQALGPDEEQAALVLGAGGWTTFFRITLPNAKWALLHGVVLCTARTVGEFGAVSVVSGHIRGQTNTLPLQVEVLYDEYRFSAAFAVASLLLLISVVTLVAKRLIEGRRGDAGTSATNVGLT